jgi:hypothetical protein
MWNLISGRLKTVLVSVQDWCTVCAQRSIGSEIILDDPMILLGEEAQVEARFIPFRDIANLNTRYVHGLR